MIDKVEKTVMRAGAKALKVSGAGGGGFMMIVCEPESKIDVARSLEQINGSLYKFKFTDEGAYSWTI